MLLFFKNVEMSIRTIDFKDHESRISFTPADNLTVEDVIMYLGVVIGSDEEAIELVNKVLDKGPEYGNIEIRDRRTCGVLFTDVKIVPIMTTGFLIVINDNEDVGISKTIIHNPITTINIHRCVKEFLSKFK